MALPWLDRQRIAGCGLHAVVDAVEGAGGRIVPALLERLGAAPEIAVGHSAGAAVALRMALDGGMRPRHIVGLNAALLPFINNGAMPSKFSFCQIEAIPTSLSPRQQLNQASIHSGRVNRQSHLSR